MKIWVDDIRHVPTDSNWRWCRSVNETIKLIERTEERYNYYKKLKAPCIQLLQIELIDIDHDAGDYAYDGGDYIKILDWLEETGRNYPIKIHSMNTVGVQNMRRIIQKNGWKEVY